MSSDVQTRWTSGEERPRASWWLASVSVVVALALSAPRTAEAYQLPPSSWVVGRLALSPLAGIGVGAALGIVFAAAMAGVNNCNEGCVYAAAALFGTGYAIGNVLGPVVVHQKYGGLGTWRGSTIGAVFGAAATLALVYYAIHYNRYGWFVPAVFAVPIAATGGLEIEDLIRLSSPSPHPDTARFVPVVLPTMYGERVTGATVGLAVTF